MSPKDGAVMNAPYSPHAHSASGHHLSKPPGKETADEYQEQLGTDPVVGFYEASMELGKVQAGQTVPTCSLATSNGALGSCGTDPALKLH